MTSTRARPPDLGADAELDERARGHHAGDLGDEIADVEAGLHAGEVRGHEAGEVGDGGVAVTMTLTPPHCPVAESMPGEVELRVGSVPGVRDAEVNLVWDPPWDPQKMSDEAKLELGML